MTRKQATPTPDDATPSGDAASTGATRPAPVGAKKPRRSASKRDDDAPAPRAKPFPARRTDADGDTDDDGDAEHEPRSTTHDPTPDAPPPQRKASYLDAICRNIFGR